MRKKLGKSQHYINRLLYSFFKKKIVYIDQIFKNKTKNFFNLLSKKLT